LANAIKFAGHGVIEISVRKEGDEAQISIKDQGPGIDPKVMPRLFKKFASRSDIGGTGLGLYISKGIVEAQNGKIWAENNKDGKGITFTFTLPYAGEKEGLESSLETQ